MSQYYFQNLFEDFSPKAAKEYIENKQLKKNVKTKYNLYQKEAFEEYLKNIQKSSDYTIYTGFAGIAFLRFLLSEKSQDPKEVKEHLTEAKKLLPIGDSLGYKRITFLCGDGGPMALSAVIEHKLKNVDESTRLIQKLISLNGDVLNPNSDMPNEFLYGRVGYLYCLLFVKKHIKDDKIIKNELIEQIVNTLIKIGQLKAKTLKISSPVMYSWHESLYLGAAHGMAGILFIIMLALPYIQSTTILNEIIRPSIDFLLSIRFPTGNFPSSLGRDSDKYVQWCHGAPGFVHLLCKAYKVFNDEKYLEAALTCGEIVWKRGLLTKGYSICHGVAGNAYTFLELFKTTKDIKHLYRACKFADWILDYQQDHEEHYPDRPLSFYEGLAGRVYFLIDIQDPKHATFPAYDL